MTAAGQDPPGPLAEPHWHPVIINVLAASCERTAALLERTPLEDRKRQARSP